jgi:hypothetical protein
VRAVGLLGGAGDVAWVEARLTSPAVEEAALLALARLRTPRAVERLTAARDEAAAGGRKDRAAWIGYLLSARFVAVDGAVGP